MTTPLPLPSSHKTLEIWLDAAETTKHSPPPTSQQIAVFEASPNDDCLNGSVLDVNQAFVVYAVKNGLIRILHRHSAVRSLLRGHAGQRMTDVRFFDQGDVLGTCAHTAGNTPSSASSTAFVWRIFEKQQPEIAFEKLLEIQAVHTILYRMVWHLFNPNQFFLLHNTSGSTKVATLVETTRIATRVHSQEGHAVCDFEDLLQSETTIQLAVEHSDLEDLQWSGKDTRHVVSVHAGGQVVLWDVKTPPSATPGRSTLTPAKLCQVQTSQPLSRCLFLPHPVAAASGSTTTTMPWTNCFCTAANENSVVTLWSPFLEGGDEPTALQTIHLDSDSDTASKSSYILTLSQAKTPPKDGSPPSCLIVLADRTAGKLFGLHVASAWRLDTPQGPPVLQLTGCNYVVPFTTKYPTYAWSVMTTTTVVADDDDEDDTTTSVNFDTTLYCYQSTVVQSLTLTASMCAPPVESWHAATPHVRVVETPALQFDAYDVEEDDDDLEDDDDDLDDYEAPEASSLPPPGGFSPAVGSVPAPTSSLLSNPFSNWLGAIAAKSAAADQEPPPPPPPVATPLPPSSASMLPVDPAIILPEAIPSMDPPPPPPPPSAFLSPADFGPVSVAVPVSAPVPAVPVAAAAPAVVVKPPQQQQQQQQGRSRSTTPNKKHGRKKSPKARAAAAAAAPAPKIAILKRQDGAPAPQAVAAPPQKASAKMPEWHDNNNDSELSDPIRKAVRQEIQAFVLPSMKKEIQQAVNESLMGPIQSSIRQLGQKGVTVDNDKLATALAKSVQEPLQAAFRSTVKKVLLPTLESVTNQVFVQVSDKLEEGLQGANNGNSQVQKELEALTLQVSTLTGLVTDLVAKVKDLQLATDGSPKQAAAPVPPPVPEANALETMRTQVIGLLQAQEYEKAFTTAVSTASIDMTVFCCRHADLTAVLGGSTPALSQPILLCLMQQLGTILPGSSTEMSGESFSDLSLELEWLQEIALSLDPADPSIHRHTPAVLQRLVANISQRMERGEPSLRRPLQRLLQVVRGMQMG